MWHGVRGGVLACVCGHGSRGAGWGRGGLAAPAPMPTDTRRSTRGNWQAPSHATGRSAPSPPCALASHPFQVSRLPVSLTTICTCLPHPPPHPPPSSSAIFVYQHTHFCSCLIFISPDWRDLSGHSEERLEPCLDVAQRMPGSAGTHVRPGARQPTQLRRRWVEGWSGWVVMVGVTSDPIPLGNRSAARTSCSRCVVDGGAGYSG